MKVTEHRPKVIDMADVKPTVKPRKTWPKPTKQYNPPLPDFQPVDDPLENVPDTGSVQGNARAELQAVQTAFYGRRDSHTTKSLARDDTEYWFAAVFESRGQKEHFLRSIGIEQEDKYVDGRALADYMGVELPPGDIDWNPRRGNWTRRREGGK